MKSQASLPLPLDRVIRRRYDVSMKWIFGKIPGASGSFKDSGGVGNQGELYFIPASKPSLKAPSSAMGKEITIPLFPRNHVLGPMVLIVEAIIKLRLTSFYFSNLLSLIAGRGLFTRL